MIRAIANTDIVQWYIFNLALLFHYRFLGQVEFCSRIKSEVNVNLFMLFHDMIYACKEGFCNNGRQVSLITWCLKRFWSWKTDLKVQSADAFCWEHYRICDELDIRLWLYWNLFLLKNSHSCQFKLTSGIPWHEQCL